MEAVNTSYDLFYFVSDVMQILGCSKSKSYDVIRSLNRELSAKGFYVCSGRVSKSYFNKRFGLENQKKGN